MRKICAAIIAVLLYSAVSGQEAAAVDSMSSALRESKTPGDRIFWMDLLSRTMMNVNLARADSIGNAMISEAEDSRDRKLMIFAYRSNGIRCSYYASNMNYTRRAIEYFEKALAISKRNRLEEETAETLLGLGWVNMVADKNKALDYTNQAAAIISTIKNDSLAAAVQLLYGDVYLDRNNKILSLRHYLNALRIAEVYKDPSLLRSCYRDLSAFYTSIGDHDKAIDYFISATDQLEHMKHDRSVPYQRVVGLNHLGKLYADKGNYEKALDYYNRSLKLADELKFATLKVPAYTSILNQYLRTDEPRKALDYFNSPAGRALQSHLINFGFSGVIDQAYAVIYTQLDKLDSARFYFAKAAPYFDRSANQYQNIGYYAQLGAFYKKTNENEKAIEMFLRVKEVADELGQLENAERAAKHLDTLYSRLGQFQQASFYNGVYHQYKDSIETLNREKELAQVEAGDEQIRQKRLEEEKLLAKRKRDNIQYLAITIGIVGLFLLMVMLGMFKVSATTIKMVGFFSFLMFFEFIFLIFKKNIYSLTQGEPWRDLLFMIALAAILLPLHHWLEHRVIHYLTSHNRLTESGRSLKEKLFRRKKTTVS